MSPEGVHAQPWQSYLYCPQGISGSILRWENDCKDCGKLLLCKRHSVDHDVANHGSFQGLLIKKAMETMNIPPRPKLTGLIIHSCNEVLFLVMLQIYKFLSHWMACKSQNSDLCSQASIGLWLIKTMWSLWKLIQLLGQAENSWEDYTNPHGWTIFNRPIGTPMNMTSRKWAISIIILPSFSYLCFRDHSHQ